MVSPGVNRPAIMYAPQNPILVPGTILDQLYYPKTPADSSEKDIIDQQYDQVKQCLQAVGLVKIFNQRLEGAFGKVLTSTEWHELMSPGEMQRLVIARFFFHLPVFAVLDEATNAIDAATEQDILELLWAAGVTTICISHRSGFVKDQASIAVFLDGQGNHQIEQK